MSVVVPRIPSLGERAVLMSLLGVDFPGVESLRRQAQSAEVVGRCDCGCPSIELKVAEDAPVIVGLTSLLAPVEASVSATGENLSGGILLFVEEGRLSYLEYYCDYGAPPKTWPSPDRLAVSVRER